MSDKRVIVVTGASRGIGRAVAVTLSGPNTEVFINFRSGREAAEETAAAVTTRGGNPHLVPFSVSDGDAVKDAFKEIVKSHGRVDVLVNNAGVAKDNLLALMKAAEWDDVLDTNLKGVFLCSQGVVKTMMKQRFGRIVNITSIVGVIGNPGQSNYCAAKAGIIGLTRSMARELISRNITVNAVAPGFIETDMTREMTDKVRESLLTQIPAGHYGAPEDVAAAVQFLVSEGAGYITGQVIHVNGGMFMG